MMQNIAQTGLGEKAALFQILLDKGDQLQLENNLFYQYEDVCNYLCKVPGIRFAAIINKNGRKIAGGFSPRVIPLENDKQKIEMLFIEIALDLSMRKEFNNSLGNIQGIVSYRDKTNIVTIPHHDNLLLLSTYPELDSAKVIQIAYQSLGHFEKREVEAI